MDFLTALNLDAFYAHQKPWHSSLCFLVPARLNQLNSLVIKINTTLNTPPSSAHFTLYTQFSSPYFWQSMMTHEGYAEAKEIWEQTHLAVYTNNETLIWFVDYAFPLLEEMLFCGQKECQTLIDRAETSAWQYYFPGYALYLNGINQLNIQLTKLKINLDLLKEQKVNIAKIKLEKNNDILKLIAQKINVPCDFESLEIVSNNAFMFLLASYSQENIVAPKKLLDKNPAIISSLKANEYFQFLTDRLRNLKRQYRLNVPEIKASEASWFKNMSWVNSSFFYQPKLFMLQKAIRYAGLPILAGLFFTGWVSIPTFTAGTTAFLTYPYLTKIAGFIVEQYKNFNAILQPYSDAYYRDFLVEHTEYIETIERSALWRKNRLATGCHHVATFEPNLILKSYTDFQEILTNQTNELTRCKPYSWQIWRYKTTRLIDDLLSELRLEQSNLTQDIQLYAADIAQRVNQVFLSPNPNLFCSMNNLTTFVSRFAPEVLPNLNLENNAIDYFLSCLCESSTTPITLSHPLIDPTGFATHCCDVASMNQLIIQVRPYIKRADKLQAILGLAKLITQEHIISPEQVDNHIDLLFTDSHHKNRISTALQDTIFSTFNGHFPALIKNFTPQQYENFSDWINVKQPEITQAHDYFQAFLALPESQDWSELPDSLNIVSPDVFQHYLKMISLNEALDFKQVNQTKPSIREQLKNKILLLVPNYTGGPSDINQWINVLWQPGCPPTLDEIILQARFSWVLDKINAEHNLNTLELFKQDAMLTYPRADNNHRLSRALVNHPEFYLPWNGLIQKTVDNLEENGLLLPNAGTAYRRKALQNWLLK